MIYSVATSPTDAIVAVVGRRGRSGDGFLKVYDLRDGKKLAVLIKAQRRSNPFMAVRFAPNGQLLAAGDPSGTISLWTVKTLIGEHLSVELVEQDSLEVPSGISCLGFSPDGTVLVAGCKDTTVRAYELASGNLVGELKGHSGAITSIALSPDQGRLASAGGSDGIVKLWTFSEFEEVATLQRGAGYVRHVAVTPAGNLMTTWGGATEDEAPTKIEHPRELLRQWDCSTGELIRAFHIDADRANSVSVSPDGLLFAVGLAYENVADRHKTRVAIIDAQSGKELGAMRGRWLAPIGRWSSVGRQLIIVGGRHVQSWDVADPTKPVLRWSDKWNWRDPITTKKRPEQNAP